MGKSTSFLAERRLPDRAGVGEWTFLFGGSMSNGQSIVIKGDISGSEDLVIAGRVEGSINLDGRVLTLAPGSHVVGDVAAGTVVVSGRIEGTIEAETRLDIK